ncbi:MAG: WG repeat-containing protein [Oscillospiraceae bacterium]|nr:WG repeat-containing protein [Oscillospiraceae bacterium]
MKKLTAVFLVIAMVTGTFQIASTAATTAGALAVLRHVSGGTQLTPEQREALGIGADEAVTTAHALEILRTAANTIYTVDVPLGGFPTTVSGFSEGLARIEVGGKCGFIDDTGEIVIPLEYDSDRYSYFSEGLALVYTGGSYRASTQRERVGGKCGYIDKSGEVIIPLQYDNATAFSEGLAIVEKDEKQYIIDKTGEIVAELDVYYDEVRRFWDGLASVRIANEYGFIDTTGKEVIPVGKYDVWQNFIEGLAVARSQNKYGFIDKTGEIAIPFNYNWLYSFSDGLAVGYNYYDDEYNPIHGVINKLGEVVIPFEYDYIGDFSEGLMAFKKDGEYGYMDETGQVVISRVHKEMRISFSRGPLFPFNNGFAVVHNMVTAEPERNIMDMSSYEKWGVIDKAGNEVIPLKYDYISSFNDGLAVALVGHADFYHNYFSGEWTILQIDGDIIRELTINIDIADD